MKAPGLPRRAEIERSTTETQIHVELALDGNGQGKVATTIPFPRSHADPVFQTRVF